jgi:hypothetical protein
MSFDALSLLRFVHLLFAFAYAGSLVIADWNGRAARNARGWDTRAALFDVAFHATTIAGLGGLLVLGLVGNMLSVALGYRMASDTWMHWVNGLWVLAVVVMAAVNVPATAALARLAKQMRDAPAGAETPSAFSSALLRWRLARMAQNLLFLAMLVLMVFRWRG